MANLGGFSETKY